MDPEQIATFLLSEDLHMGSITVTAVKQHQQVFLQTSVAGATMLLALTPTECHHLADYLIQATEKATDF